MTRDSGRHSKSGDAKQAPSEGCQSGPKGIAQMTSPNLQRGDRELTDAEFLRAVVLDVSKPSTAARLERIANRLQSPEAVTDETLIEAGNAILERMSSTYRARNGREMGIEGDDGEKCWIVHSDDIETLRAALLKVSPR